MEQKSLQSFDNNVVTKSNILIEANYKLTLTEQKIILFIVSKIRQEDDDFQTYDLPIKQFYKMIGYQANPKYTDIRKITKGLMAKILEIKEHKTTKQMSWLSYVEYNENEGNVKLSFDPRLKPYLLQLKREFTSYKLKNVMALNSGYSIRIYEILKKWQTLKEVEVSLEELRKMVGSTDKYREYHNFKKRILKFSQEEIEEKTDISFEFKEIKVGRKVDSIRFIIHSKKNVMIHEDEVNKEDKDLLESLYAQLYYMFKDNAYTLSKNIVKRWVRLAEKIWNEDKYVEIDKLTQQIFQIDHIKNHIAFITYILNEKVKCVENGMDHDQVNVEMTSKKIIRKEMLPSWFEENEEVEMLDSDFVRPNKRVADILNDLKKYRNEA